MKSAPIPREEDQRKAALDALEVLDTAAEQEFDDLAVAASLVCGVPISLLSLVDTHRQWFKANVGLNSVTETPRDVAFCAHAIHSDAVFEVPDARLDERFADNPLVTSDPQIRFYAGVPIRLRDGARVGTLWVIDRVPRELTSTQKDVLARLASAAARALETRKAERDLLAERQRLNDILNGTAAGTWTTNLVTGQANVNARWAEIFGETLDGISPITLQTWYDRLHPADVAVAESAMNAHFAGHTPRYECEFRMRHKTAGWVWIFASGVLRSRTADGKPEWFSGTHLDITGRKSAEEQFKLSESRYRQMYEATPALLYSIDPNGLILNVSNKFAERLGVTRAALIGQHLATLMTPAAARFAREEGLPAFMQRGSAEKVPYQYLTRNGEVVDVLVSAILERDSEGNPLRSLSVAEDVTERLRAEALVREERERLSSIVKGTHAGTWEDDLVTGERWINDIYAHMLGYTREEATERVRGSFLNMVHPEDQRQVATLWDAHLRGVTTDFEAEFRMRHKDGSWPWVLSRGMVSKRDADGRAMRISGIQLDISVRHAATEAAKQANRDLQNTLDAIPFLIAYWDKHLINRFANAAYINFFGVKPDALKSQHISQLLGGEIYAKNLPYIDAALRGEEQNFEREIPSPDGLSVKHSVARYLPDVVNGEVQGFYVFVYDVSDIKQAQQQLIELNASLQQRTREAESASASKAQFLANMSHEIRTPMNAILGLLTLLNSTALTPQQRDYTSKTQGAAQSLLGLLNDILDFSKVEAGKMSVESEPFKLEKILRNLSVVLSANVGNKDVDVLFDIDPAVPTVLRGDGMRLQQVLINLAGNAVKFTHHGNVVLSVKKLAEAAQSVTLEFSVQDTGIGIAPEHLSHIFDGFSQAEGSTTRRFGGTGLGLAISKRLVQLMNGDIQVVSQLGEGSVFSFVLELPVPQPPTAARPVAAPVPSARVLWIENEPVSGTLTLRNLQAWGWSVSLATTGGQAMELLKEQAVAGAAEPPFSVLFLAANLPDMDVWDLARKIRNHGQAMGAAPPVLLLVTSHGQRLMAERNNEFAKLFNSYVVKPYSVPMLSDVIAEAQKAVAPARAAVVAPPREEVKPLKGMRILVVDDNRINQQVADELLRAQGALVTLAENGQVGVETVAATKPQFDVVLMDIQMPVLDGYGATRKIRNDLGLTELPIIAMTANAMATDREVCLAAGMNEHIGKPFDIAQLVALLVRMTHFDVQRVAPKSQSKEPVQRKAATAVDALDTDGALRRMSGLKSLYVRTAKAFVGQLDTLVAELTKSLEAGNQKAVLMGLHTLKGNASTLGVQWLAGLAAEHERQCKAEPSFDNLRAAVAAVGEAAPRAQAQLREAIGQLDLPEAKTPAPVTPTAQPAAALEPEVGKAPALTLETAHALQKLAQLAAASNMDALAHFDSARDSLIQLTAAQFEALDLAVHRLDFETVRAQCEGLLAGRG